MRFNSATLLQPLQLEKHYIQSFPNLVNQVTTDYAGIVLTDIAATNAKMLRSKCAT